jgi:hypothetical protein
MGHIEVYNLSEGEIYMTQESSKFEELNLGMTMGWR